MADTEPGTPAPEHASLEELEQQSEELEKVEEDLKSELGTEDPAPAS